MASKIYCLNFNEGSTAALTLERGPKAVISERGSTALGLKWGCTAALMSERGSTTFMSVRGPQMCYVSKGVHDCSDVEKGVHDCSDVENGVHDCYVNNGVHDCYGSMTFMS